MNKKTCKECSNYRGIDDRTGKIKCAILGTVCIRKMDKCMAINARICAKCGRVTNNPIFYKDKAYCPICYNKLFIDR